MNHIFKLSFKFIFWYGAYRNVELGGYKKEEVTAMEWMHEFYSSWRLKMKRTCCLCIIHIAKP